MWVINYVKATNDKNGNPRRGWFCQLPGTDVTHWIEEGYGGEQYLKDWQRRQETLFLSNGFFFAVDLSVTVKEYKRLWAIAKEHH